MPTAAGPVPARTNPAARRIPPLLPLLALGLAGFILLTWRLAGLSPLTYAADSPQLAADGFYAPETGEGGTRFRWSRPRAGLLLPALAARQVYTIELTTPRPPGVAQPAGLVLVANGQMVPVAPAPGWATSNITAPSQVGLANAVALVAATTADSFYPTAGDRRLLTAAVRRVSMAPAAGPGNIIWPAPVPGAAALLVPLLAFMAAGIRRAGLVWAGGAAAGLALAIAAVPAPALPGVLGSALGLLALAAVTRGFIRYGEAGMRPISIAFAHPRWGRPAEWGGLIATYLAGALLATWPLAAHFGDAVPGWPGDNFAFLYKIWWVKRALLTGANLFNDPNVFYPAGFNFGRGEPTLPNTVPGALVAAIWSDAAGYNTVLLAGFVLSGLGTYALARTLGCRRAAALLAGIVFMLAPYRLAQASGHLQIAATAPIPWTLFFADRALRRGGRDALWAGLCFGLTVLTAWYYAIIGGVLLAGYVLVRVWETWRGQGDRPALVGGRQAALALLVFGIVAGAVALPGLIVALGAAGEAPLTHSAKAADENSASLADYVLPNELHPLWGPAAMRARGGENIIESGLYLGIPALALAAVALWPHRGRPGRGARGWALAGAGCLVLSLGLTLRILPGEVISLGGAPVPMPARVLFDWVPGFNSLRAYARFGGAVALVVAVLAGLGAARLLAVPRWRAHAGAVAAGLLGLVLADFWSAPNAWGVTHVAPDAVARWLATQPAGAVMRLPLTAAIAGPPLYAGIGYGHPLAYGYETFEPPAFRAARPVLARFPDPAAFAQLRTWGVRYVVVAASAYGPAWPGTKTRLDALAQWTPVFRAEQPVTYDAPFWIGDAQPDLAPAFAPDELVVYQLK